MGYFRLLLPQLYNKWMLNMHTSVDDKAKDLRILLHRQFDPTPRFLYGYDKQVWINTVSNLPQTEQEQTNALLGKQNYVSQTNYTNPLGLKEYELKEIVKTAEKPMSKLEDLRLTASVNIDVNKELDAVRDKGKTEYTSILEYLENQYPRMFTIRGVNAFYKNVLVEFRYITNDIQTNFTGTQIYNIFDENNDLFIQDIDKIIINEDLSYRDLDLVFSPTPRVPIYLFIKKTFQKEPMGLRSTPFQGYTLSKDFYSPVYPAGKPVLDPDYRRTLYWNPDIILDKTGNARVEFYNNGSCKLITVSAEGIASNGALLLNQ